MKKNCCKKKEPKELSMDELLSIQEGTEDAKDGRIYKMQKGEDLSDFLKRAATCMK